MPSPAVSGPLVHARSPAVRQRWLSELAHLVAIPSVSADPARRSDVEATSTWLARHLAAIGMQAAQVLPSIGGGAPSVYAEWLSAPSQPTLLVYGHFDVQPPGQIAAWRTPPFHPTRIGQHIYARGASDDKGQLFIHLKAIECWLATEGRLPVNVKVWLEGEEEIGSPSLELLLKRERERLHSDGMLISDTEMIAAGRPSITYGLRGSLVCDLALRGPAHDLHSGRFGGATTNPLQALCTMLASLYDAQGGVAVPGFYNQVRPVSAAERATLQRDGRSDYAILAAAGQAGALGEPGYTLFERATIRPALNITGVRGGTVGPGATSSVPAWATARLNVRLVPDQDPASIAAALQRYLTQATPPGTRLQLRFHRAIRPVLLSLRHPLVAAAARAVEQTYELPPAFVRSGGSIGPVEVLYRQLRVPIVLLGFGQAGDRAHAPNERFSLATLYRGVETSIRLLAEYQQ